MVQLPLMAQMVRAGWDVRAAKGLSSSTTTGSEEQHWVVRQVQAVAVGVVEGPEAEANVSAVSAATVIGLVVTVVVAGPGLAGPPGAMAVALEGGHLQYSS